MTTVFAFCFGALFSGIVLAIVFGAFHLEAEEKAYQRGYADGLRKGKE
jgi:hypothetical protein